jgi:hypothetical protein
MIKMKPVTVIPGRFRCIACTKSRARADESSKTGLCQACNSRLKAAGIRTYGEIALIPCTAPGCGNNRRVSLGYALSLKYDGHATCMSCSQKRQQSERRAQMATLIKPKTIKMECDPGCTIPRKRRECRLCGDKEACIERK